MCNDHIRVMSSNTARHAPAHIARECARPPAHWDVEFASKHHLRLSVRGSLRTSLRDSTISPPCTSTTVQKLLTADNYQINNIVVYLIAQQSLARLRTAFGDEGPCKKTIYNWFAEFKRGQVNLSDEFRDRRTSNAVNDKNIDAERRMIETDRHVIYHEIRTSLSIGMSQIQSMLHKYLGTKKLCSRWIPHNLTEVQKTDLVTWYNAMITRFKERC
ncbi:Histone-lysine N-methyltransferase SETMAR [Eumeta japonica]|uniref:Histone-lysine N-methyltransferase SETMAR n=1 Tax=Eumeta variegata TaxID=151549 RepID=A0A4C1Y3Z0_EUMVA|nr:Histone-lysine N-methyltransferase SETMAR [Eumeta japonica]